MSPTARSASEPGCWSAAGGKATPPVPGANLLAYIIIFGQLGIPGKALIDAMIFDILFGIFASAANQTVLQMDLIIQADKIGLLDLKKLRKE